MVITYSVHTMPDGYKVGEEWIEVDAPGVVQMFVQLQTGELSLETTGWGADASHPDYPGLSKFEVVKAEAKRLACEPLLTALAQPKKRAREPHK